MRLLVTSFPGYGHIHPLMPLALAGAERGHDVLIATGSNLADWVAACGLPVTSAGGSIDELIGAAAARFDSQQRTAHLFTTIAVPLMARDLLEVSKRWYPDLIIHEESEYAAPLVGELLKVPCVTHSWAAPAKPEADRIQSLALLEPIWAELGAAEPRIFGKRYLDACPPPFQSDAVHSITGVSPIRPVPFDGPSAAPPAWISKIERPAAYVSFGTVRRFSQPEVLQSTLDAVAQVVATTVVTTGPNPQDSVRATGLKVFVEQYVPQSVVLPHMDVVISHGGAGTTLGAVMHGLPHVVLPQNPWSQTRNAERVAALGIGIHVKGEEQVLRDAVVTVLTDPSYGRAASRTRDALLELPSPDLVLSGLARGARI